MFYIALTGGFGSGKTTVLRLFKRLGAFTVDIDNIVHDVLKRRDVIKDVIALLGGDVIRRSSKGVSVNRRKIAERIFDDIEKRRGIEGIIHPLVLEEIINIKSRFRHREGLLVFEIPLLYEARFDIYFDKTIVVYCDRRTAMKRLIKKGFKESEAMKRIKAQLPIEKKVMLADFIIDNSNGIKKTEDQIRRIFKKVTSSSH
ncbi:MAG: dephospho-CoA kinase [Thermodesulfovibrionia bacterium]